VYSFLKNLVFATTENPTFLVPGLPTHTIHFWPFDGHYWNDEHDDGYCGTWTEWDCVDCRTRLVLGSTYIDLPVVSSSAAVAL